MSFTTFLASVNQTILEAAQFVFPTITSDELAFYSMLFVALAAIALAVYGMNAHPHSQSDMEFEQQKSYTAGRDYATAAGVVALNSKNGEIEDLRRRLGKAQEDNKKVVDMLGKIRAEKGDTYRKDRIIASLAVDLDGYAEIEEKANRLVETLN